MASQFTQLSPGVDFREIDLTNTVGTVGASGGAFAGKFSWGPALEITTISSGTELEQQFHKPTDDNFVDWFAAYDFLAYTSNLQMVRIIDEAVALNGTDDGMGLLVKNRDHFEVVASSNPSIMFAAKYPGELGNGLQVAMADAQTFGNWPQAWQNEFDTAPGTSSLAKELGAANDELHVLVIDGHGKFTGVPGAILERYYYLSKALDSKDENNAPNYYINQINKNSAYIWAFSPPAAGSLVDPTDGTIDSLTIDSVGSGYTAATITISPPPAGGTQATATVTIDAGGLDTITITNAGSGYTSTPTVTIAGDGTGAVVTAVLNEGAAGKTWDKNFIDLGAPVLFKSLAAPLTKTTSSGVHGAVQADEYIEGYNLFQNQEEVDVSLIFMGDGGGSVNHTQVVQNAIDNIAEARRDCIVFFSPKLADVLNKTQSMATTDVVKTRDTVGRGSSYAVMDSGWKLRYDIYNDKLRWLPLNADIAGLCANVDNNFDPWISPGGYTRGKIRNVVSLAFNPNKTSRDNLYKVGINPVVTFRTDGTVLYGDKTLQGKNSAFSQIGIRRLFIMLQKATTQAAKYYLFEQNNDFTRANFVNMVKPYMEEVKGRGGVEDFLIKCDRENNTPQVIMNKQFIGQFFIKPVYSINWIRLDFVAVRQDVDFTEVVGQPF